MVAMTRPAPSRRTGVERRDRQTSRWSAGQGYGNTPLEESLGESLDQRLAHEVPEPDPYADEELDPLSDDPAVTEIPESGAQRAGRLVEPDEGVRTDTDSELTADDVGIDGAGAGAEEAAVHVVDEEELSPPD